MNNSRSKSGSILFFERRVDFDNLVLNPELFINLLFACSIDTRLSPNRQSATGESGNDYGQDT